MDKNSTILVTGVGGQLGYDICNELKARGYTNVVGVDKQQLDLTNEKAVKKYVKKLKPSVIMHNAAYTAVDLAEQNSNACFNVNVLATKYLTEASIAVNAKIVYISTDYVFNGQGDNFYNVDDAKSPLSVYGKTKLLGEEEATKNPKHFIVRTSWVFGINGKNFVKTMINLAKTKQEVNVVCDQIGSPTYTFDLAKLLCDMIVTEKYGVYHATNEGVCSWAEFAKYIFDCINAKTKVNFVTTQEYLKLVAQQAPRPLNSRLSKTSLDDAGFKRLPSWQDAVTRFIKELTVAAQKPKIMVIMSTYNGEKYLKQQLDSILAQEGVDVNIYVSDDCSTDNTVNIVNDYIKQHNNITLGVNKKNKNFTYNFLDALFKFKDNQEFDYYAFADQDDVWLSNKLITAINKIKQTGNCTLYCSNLKVVDENLQGNNTLNNKKNFMHDDIICKNFVTGCTAVFDNKFKDLATQHYPNNIYLHDYWLGLIANYCKGAHLIYDSNAYILYRQHGSNQIGGKTSVATKAFKSKPKGKCTSGLIKEFYAKFGNEIYEQDNLTFKMLTNLNLKNRLKLFFKIKGRYSNIFKIKMLLNKY